ncbi:unnamed protein product [Calypogeia fissa]
MGVLKKHLKAAVGGDPLAKSVRRGRPVAPHGRAERPGEPGPANAPREGPQKNQWRVEAGLSNADRAERCSAQNRSGKGHISRPRSQENTKKTRRKYIFHGAEAGRWADSQIREQPRGERLVGPQGRWGTRQEE